MGIGSLEAASGSRSWSTSVVAVAVDVAAANRFACVLLAVLPPFLVVVVAAAAAALKRRDK